MESSALCCSLGEFSCAQKTLQCPGLPTPLFFRRLSSENITVREIRNCSKAAGGNAEGMVVHVIPPLPLSVAALNAQRRGKHVIFPVWWGLFCMGRVLVLEMVAMQAPAFASSSCGIPVGPLHSFTHQSLMKPAVDPVQ